MDPANWWFIAHLGHCPLEGNGPSGQWLIGQLGPMPTPKNMFNMCPNVSLVTCFDSW